MSRKQDQAKEERYELHYTTPKGQTIITPGSFADLAAFGEQLAELAKSGDRDLYNLRIVKVVREFETEPED